MHEYVRLLYEASEKFGDDTALVDHGGERASDYRTFGDLMSRTAAWIYQKHLGERSFIPVRFESSLEFAAAVCGVWLSGHIAVPMGLSFPPERIRYITMNCNARFTIDDEVIDEIRKTEPKEISVYPDSGDDDPALLLYTSGSTGMPKGILHSFKGLYANQQMGNRATYSTGQIWAMGAPFYFVASVAIYKVLTLGGCVHLMDEATMRDVRALEDYYEKHKITIGFISPSVLANFQNRSESLKVVMTGSERLTGQCSRDGYKLYNNYGLSETMGTVCSFLVDKPYDTTPVGIPAEGTDWALLDDNMNPVPDGEEGEYCTKGPYTLGYYKDPEATAKLFRGGWLHTGDILKKLPDGNLVYINRKDWMVKINGQRVEPGEIENVLRTVPGVGKAVVKAVKGAGGKIVLCAYYTGDLLEDSFISEKLSEKLASYMIPTFYMHMDGFPINANGKIDRKNLPEPDISSKKAEYAPPENDTETMLCRAFEEALGTDRVGIDDDFFAMGGDSIRVMKLASLCPELDLTSKIIYSARTPRAIAAECIKRGAARIRDKKEVYPLSASQLGIYIESMNRDGEAVYNNPILLKLGSGIDMEKLRAACEAVVDAHPFIKLRLSADENGDPIQRRNDDEPYSQTLEKISDADLEKLIPSLMQPFRLTKDRLFRIRLFETGTEKYLFIDLHHIIFDGSSMLVMFRDLEKAYLGGVLEKETYSGFDVAEDEKDRADERYEEAQKWYLDTFGGIDTDSLPVPDRNMPEMSFGAVEKDLAVEASETEALCRKYGITENIFATAAFGICAGLFAGTNEALFTTIYNGRDSLRTAGTIAMLVKTLPVYAHFEKDQELRDYLSRAKEQMLGCMNNDIYPFAELAASTGMNSDLLFVYQGDVLNVGGFANEPVERIPLMENATGEKITIQMYKQGGLYNIRAEYRADLYSEEFIRIILNSYETVLRNMFRAETVGDISIAGPEELNRLEKWNQTDYEYDRTQTVVSLFESAAEKYPDREAVIYLDERLTYREVDRRSDAIAAYIEGQGLKPGDVAAILIPRGVYQVVASLGVLKAGCAYQPLDATYPTERLNFMVKDSAASLLITTEKLGELITEYDGMRLTLTEIEKLPDKEPAAVSRPEDLFILLYTSGTTGVPKGVKLTHENLVCFIDWYNRFYHITEDDRVAQYASYGFDACMMDMYPALAAGAAVVIVSEELRLDLAAMNDYLISNKVTVAFMTTQVGRQYAAEMKNPYMRAISIGGEKLAPMDPPKGLDLYNAYGPTECTIFSTIYHVTRREDNIPIGKPLQNLKCYVVDPFGHLLPPGALGELLIAGPHVGTGYLNRPDKTEEVFITNPFDGGDYERAYRSGDIVRFRTDGEIEFIGRRDGQVKIHGFRVELSEVEAIIRDFAGIRNVAVVARDLGADGKAIAAYFVSDEKIDPKDIADYIRERKPPYMVPSSIMQIDKIPLNQNGKVNRRALPEPVVMAAPEDTSHVDNVLETELKAVIGEALNMENPSLNTPLEYLGLTSIGTIRLSTKLFNKFGVNISVREFAGLSITDIENLILRKWMNGNTPDSGDTLLQDADDEASSPLSAAQMGIYLDCMKKPDSTAYNIPSVMSFDADTDPERLSAAVEKVLKCHPSVFVHFEITDNQVTAVKDPVEVSPIPVTEMSEAEANDFRLSFVRPFHLNRGPLFEFAIVRTPDAVLLFMDFHHLVFDGFSMSLFLKDLEKALKNDGSGPEPERASYAEYARAQKKILEGEKAGEYEEYFGTLFEDFDSATEIPADVPAGSGTGSKKLVYYDLDEKASRKACRYSGVSEAAFYLASLDYTIARITAEDTVYVSTISSGRSDVRFAGTFGMFVNTLPLKAALSDATVNDFIRDVAADLDKALAHENYPFAEIAGKWGFSVNIMYEYQRGVVEKPDIPGLVKIEPLELLQTKFGITVRIIDRENAPAIEVEYNDAVYSAGAVEEFIRSWLIVIDKFSKHGREKVRSISLLDEERSRLLDTFRERPVKPALPSDVLFHSGMERMAKERPDHTALIACDGHFTYKEFDENANRIANALIARGIKKGDRVVLLLPRTSGVLFSIFGTLKTGAAYIPCDPNYPVERVRHIVEDSNAALIITTTDRLDRFREKPAVDVNELLKETNTVKPDVEISQDDLAYLIYTSGSTGKPKGVMLKHKGIVNYVTNTPGNILVNGMTEKGHVLTAVTTLSFDFSIKEWGVPLFNGLTLSFAADDECNDAAKLAARMKMTNTDIFGSTPSRILALMESDDFNEALENCSVVICGGEKYPDKLLKALKGSPGRLIFNTYGPTETTVSSNTQELSGYDTVNAGPPLPGVTEFIVDTDGNEVPLMVIGELYIGGLGVAAGYNNLPEKTKEQFTEYRGQRIYKSGDYARWTGKGDVEILGRRDNQIKLRGLRIELDEVEAVLASVSGIGRTAVKIEKLNGIEHLCAWFTADHKVDIGELKKELGRTLTGYMVPTAYMQLDEMPMTPNGKLDLKNLPIPELYRSGDSEKAATSGEKAFSEIFSRLLHVEDVGANENFFELGGTSLLVTNVVIEAGRMGYAITFGDVFDNPTPRALASLACGEAGKENGGAGKDEEVTGYDYSAVRELLQKNTLETFKEGELYTPDTVLLTGSTGYLGIHVLHELIEKYECRIYCLHRSQSDLTAEERLNRLYFYYFDTDLSPIIGNRLFITNGDITDPSALETLTDKKIDMVINCAAIVKHFASGSLIEDVNVGGVLNLIDFCIGTGAVLIQTSTMSVVSSAYKDSIPEGFRATEQSLYFDQVLDNKYIHSKFLAERAVLDAVAKKGLRGKVMRFGNLSARHSDGEFQINFDTNSAMGRLRAFTMLGCAAYDQLDNTMEFSPIDTVAEAVVILSGTPDDCTVFHVFNNQNISMERVFHELSKLGYTIRYVERPEFAKAFAEAGSDPEKAAELTSIMAYMTSPGGREAVRLERHCEYTMQVLYRLGFRWPATTWDYIQRFVSALAGLGYFEE